MNQLSWFSTSNKHRLKLTTGTTRRLCVEPDDEPSRLILLSLAQDFANDQPASFTQMSRRGWAVARSQLAWALARRRVASGNE
jgi:hypothetical protein